MLFFLCLVAIGFALWNRASINQLAGSILVLERELAILRRASAGAGMDVHGGAFGPMAPGVSAPPEVSAVPVPESVAVEEAKPDTAAPAPALDEAFAVQHDRPTNLTPPTPESAPEPKATSTAVDLERQFGARLPVWIGGVALALAGFFLVRYTIEIGLLTETVRVVLGGMFGIALIAAGHWVRRKAANDNGDRIAQALSGAGIADLYASLFVATTLYHLLSPLAGFVGMAAVTVGAVALSLRHGAPIAVLGLVGGFLTPMMTGATEPNAPLLFGYLYCLLAGFFTVIRKKGWWLLATPTVLAAFLWVLVWAQGGFDPRDAIWPLLYVIAISATVAFTSHRLEAETDGPVDLTSPMAVLRYISLGGGILLAGGMSSLGGFEPTDWSLFGLLTAGAIALAALKPRIYNFAPIAALAMSFAMFAVWATKTPEPLTFGVTIVAFGLLHCVSGYALMWRSPIKSIWGTLIAAAALGYYLLAYAHLHETLADLWPGFPIWGVLALGLALGAARIVAEILKKLKEEEPAQALLLAVFSAAAACFLTIGLAIELPRQSLYVAVAVEVLAAAWLATKLPVNALRPIAAALLALFGMLILPELALFVQLAVSNVSNEFLTYRNVPVIDWPIIQFGVPAVMFLVTSLLLRGQKSGAFVKVLESVTAGLVGATIYCLTRQAFHPEGNALLAQPGDIERSVTTNVFFLSGLAALWLGRRFERVVSIYAALALSVVGLFRTLPELMFLLQLAIWSLGDVSPSGVYGPAIDWPILQFGLPALMFFAASLLLRGQKYEVYVQVLESATAVLAGAMIYCLTRQAFHPEGSALLAPASFIERGVTTNIFFLVGLGTFWLGRRFHRNTWTYGGLTFSAIALFRIVYFDLLTLNPVWSHQFVGDLPLINGLALPFALPIAWSVIAAREILALGRRDVAAFLNGLGFVLLFVLVTLGVRQLYWGGYLDGGSTIDSEIYAYSAAWLLMGIGLLIAGTIRREQMIRIASLVVMLIAVGKVFLIDASSLEGLYRVVSFFGLGVTLIALSWFYTRYVFAEKEGAPIMTRRRKARSA